MSDNFKNFLLIIGIALVTLGILGLMKDIDRHDCTNLAAEFKGNGKLYGKQCLITTATGHKLALEVR